MGEGRDVAIRIGEDAGEPHAQDRRLGDALGRLLTDAAPRAALSL